MADAIHEIDKGAPQTLRQIAVLYYAVRRPGGDLEPGRVKRVTAAIRARTGEPLKGTGDDDPIRPGTVLRIPTLRELPRAVLCDTPALLAALMAAGYDHANKLLRRTPQSVVDTMGPYEGKAYDARDVLRVVALTSLFDLDGMDTRTAIYLHDVAGLHSLAALASQAEASIQRTLEFLVSSKGGRPKALASEGHARRWRASALVLGRRRFSERARHRPYQVPFPSRDAAARAAHYEAIVADPARRPADRDLARRLARLHRFQAQVIDGNFHALARRWDRASASYQSARALFHRLAEDVGAAKVVDDRRGLALDAAIATAYRLLKQLPPDTEAPLGAPLLRRTFDDSSRPYGLSAERSTAGLDVVTLSLPSPTPGGAPVRLRLDDDTFTASYKTTFLNRQLASATSPAIRTDSAAWVDPAAFAAITPLLYGGTVRAGLGVSLAAQGQVKLANEYSSPYFDLVDADGKVVAEWSQLDTYVHDLDLGTCSTDFVDPDGDGVGVVLEEMRSIVLPLSVYCETRFAAGDALYKQNRRSEASAVYADVICAIENYWKATDRSYLASDARIAFGAVANAALSIARGRAVEPFRSTSQLTLLAAAHEDGTPVADGWVVSTTHAASALTFEDRARSASSWFSMEDGGVPGGMQGLEAIEMNETLAGSGVATSLVTSYVDARLVDAYYFDYLYAQSKFQAIATGLNWFGYPDAFVPSWSFDYLFEVAGDLAGKAVDAERQVFQMEQLFEQAAEKEFLASQAVELAEEQLAVADARVAQAEAAALLASQQARLTVAQADAAANQAAFRAGIEFDNSEVQSALVADPETGEIVPAEDLFSDPYDITNVYEPRPERATALSTFAGVLSAIPLGGTFGAFLSTGASTETARNEFVTNLGVLQQAVAVAQATEVANAAACATAAAERDVAQVTVNQAQEYLEFLENQTLNSEALEQLVAMAAEVHGIYHYQAHRMAWLAERAASYESRRTFAFIGWNYETGDALRDMMRSEFLRVDLDSLRAEVTAGQSTRFQELRWTVPLSKLDPAALLSLRTTGQGVFVLRQDRIDREFPGTMLHRLKDLQVSFVGLLPPGGPRGVLSMSGVSWVRVPNTGEYAIGETTSDWTTDALAGTSEPYDSYVMKRLDATPADVSLSEFDVARDRAVLSAPRGMLRALENLGLDTAWTLSVPARSNPFLLANIRDVELTFWFLCGYDAQLHAAQDRALHETGRRGGLTSAVRLSAAASAADALQALRGPAPPDGQVDTRYVAWNVFGLPQDESGRRIRNLRTVFARRAGTADEITFRLLARSAPAGVRLRTSEGAAVSYIGVDTTVAPNSPTEDAAVRDWLTAEFYRGRKPSEDPQQTWAIKVSADHVGAAWEARDEDGTPIVSTTGPLTASGGGRASFSGGASWTDYAATLNVRTGGSGVSLLVRHDPARGGSGYALTIDTVPTNNIRLVKLTNGAPATLARATIPYPADEFLAVTLFVFGDASSTTLTAVVDRIPILDATDTSKPHVSGTVALAVSGGGTAAFDDLRVVRLTRRGAMREMLHAEPFDTLPSGWTFTDGATPWVVDATRHKRLDLSKVLNVVITLDYQFAFASLAPGSPS
jgi:hypothetical protein